MSFSHDDYVKDLTSFPLNKYSEIFTKTLKSVQLARYKINEYLILYFETKTCTMYQSYKNCDEMIVHVHHVQLNKTKMAISIV